MSSQECRYTRLQDRVSMTVVKPLTNAVPGKLVNCRNHFQRHPVFRLKSAHRAHTRVLRPRPCAKVFPWSRPLKPVVSCGPSCDGLNVCNVSIDTERSTVTALYLDYEGEREIHPAYKGGPRERPGAQSIFCAWRRRSRSTASWRMCSALLLNIFASALRFTAKSTRTGEWE